MKSISAEAMAAIEAGEVIVTGALEIYTPGRGPVGVPEASDVILNWQQTGDDFAVFPNTGRMKFEFFDETNASLGTTAATMLNTTPHIWTLRTLNGSTPAGAIRMRVSMEIDRLSGLYARCGFDDISLTIGGTDVPLTNPGAELGSNLGWTSTLGEIQAVTSTDWTLATAYEGTYFFAGNINNAVSAYQDVYLSEVIPIEPGTVEAVIRVWGGYGTIELDGETYDGVGDRGLVQQSGGAVGGVAQGLELVLSRIEPELLALLDAEEIRGGAVIMRRLIFASDGKTLLDYDIWDRGRVDAVETRETVGGGAAIKVSVESAARGLGKAGARMRSDSDQRLINPNDGYFRKTAYAGEKMLYWGGKRPARTTGSTYIGSPSSGG